MPVWPRFLLFQLRRVFCAGAAVFPLWIALAGVSGDTTNFLIDVWDTEDNLPSSTVTAVTQTPDGYLWVGTYNGLSRFDGVRFVTFDPVNTPALAHARIQGLYVDARGTLWINTYRGGLTSYRDGVFRSELPDRSEFFFNTMLVSSTTNSVVFVTQYGEVMRRRLDGDDPMWKVITPPGGSRPTFECVDGSGILWFLSRDGHILRLVHDQFQELPPDNGLPTNFVFTLVADSQGRVWTGTPNEIARWNGERFEDMTPTNGERRFSSMRLFPAREGSLWVLADERLREAVGREWVAEAKQWRGLLGDASGRQMGFHEDRSGGIWFNHYGNGLFHITPDGQYQRLTSQNGLPGDRVGAWFQGREGSIWIGVDRGGLARLRDREFQVIGPAEGLPARATLSVCEGNDGAMWIGTGGGGLCRWQDGKIKQYDVGNSASANFVFSMYPRADNGLWLSAGEGEDLFEFTNGRVRRADWDLHGVKALLVDREDRAWAGTKIFLAWWTPEARKTFGTNDGMASSVVRSVVEAPDGSIWCGADDGTLYQAHTNALREFRANDNLADQPVLALHADTDGVIWAGTFRGGLLRFKNGKFTRFTRKQGLPANVICQILEDGQGRLWLGTHQGICHVSKQELNECAEGRRATVDSVTYGRLDGLPTLECSDGYQPACWRSHDGRLWFATVKGVVSVDPAHTRADSLPPPVVIEEMLVDGEPEPLRQGRIVIPPGHRQFEFRYTALSFEAPDKMRFRYRIDKLDKDWVNAGTRRTTTYSHLGAGNYRFHVIACNNDGVWNDVGASVVFIVRPFFYQTWWFLTLSGLLVLGSVAVAARTASSRKYERVLARMEQQHAIERDRARIAKDIHDDIGAGLTQITLLGELARREPEHSAAHLDRISCSARQMTRAMDEIVWAVDPQHDTFIGLMDYVSAFAEDFLRVAGIRCRMDLPNSLPDVQVDAELRYNLFLAVKETLNNIVKHSHATEVWLRLRLEPGGFALEIEDNGQGLFGEKTAGHTAADERLRSGAGMGNLERRLASVGGRCIVRSAPGKGTCVEMTVRVPTMVSPNGDGSA